MALQHAKAGEIVDLRPLGPKLKDAKTSAMQQEPYLCANRDPYFDQIIVLAHSDIDGAIRSLRGIVAHLSNIKSA
jgi:hypothetical protein